MNMNCPGSHANHLLRVWISFLNQLKGVFHLQCSLAEHYKVHCIVIPHQYPQNTVIQYIWSCFDQLVRIHNAVISPL